MYFCKAELRLQIVKSDMTMDNKQYSCLRFTICFLFHAFIFMIQIKYQPEKIWIGGSHIYQFKIQ